MTFVDRQHAFENTLMIATMMRDTAFKRVL